MKKFITYTLSLVLVAALAISGTVAYLTQDLGSKNNVFSVGNINVTLEEEVDILGEGGTVSKTETGADYSAIMPGDYLQKEVTVKNNGLTDAYVAVTVDVNNFKQIQKVIEGYGDDDQNAETMLDLVFDGWGLTVKDRYVDGVKDMSYKVNEFVDSNILHVDSAKRITASDVAHFSINNWFKSDTELKSKGYTVAGAKNGYYTATMEDYSLRYTYYIFLEAGEETRIFNGLNVPAEFTNEQMEMFDGLEINVEAKAIQADNMRIAKEYKDDVNGKAKTAFALLDGTIKAEELVKDTWDGTVDTSWYNSTDKEFTLTTAEQLAGLAKLVNEGTTFSGKTITLDVDADLLGKEWTPVGNSSYSFKGIFNGNGYTVSNLVITGYNSNVGLFGYTTNGEIKNLTVENAKVSGRLNVAVVAGTPYTSKYTNVTVKGHVEVNAMSYAGTVGGKNAYANWSNITVDVDNTSYVKANSVENGNAYRTYVGGVIGFIGEGSHTFENVKSNINVIGTTCDVGGITGIAHYGNTFKNCSSSGNVEITNAAEVAEAEEIGGIAGVWHNSGSNVTFEGCLFTGKLTTNITDGVDLSDNIIHGAAYSTTGSGQVIVK